MLKTWFGDQRFKSTGLLCWRLLMNVCLTALFHNGESIYLWRRKLQKTSLNRLMLSAVVVNAASARGRLTKIAHSLRVSALVFVSLTRAPGGTRHRSNLSSVWSNRAVGYCSNPPANLNESQKFFIAITGKGFMQPKIVCGDCYGLLEVYEC